MKEDVMLDTCPNCSGEVKGVVEETSYQHTFEDNITVEFVDEHYRCPKCNGVWYTMPQLDSMLNRIRDGKERLG